jgi:peptidoglycan/LPS O-acetylase OafA/YrhL
LSSYRPEIDGLRAIAVLSVLMFHAGIAPFSGGFVGVDVFFVISGYLITRNISAGLLSGTFSFRQFYLARLRRLYPALLATVTGTLLLGALLFSPALFAKLAAAAIASLLMFSNIYFWTEVGYWDLETGLKPLLHVWSLSVEEQFYFIWPLLLFAASRLKNARTAIVVAVAVCGIVSFCFASNFARSTVFFWMPLRAFEFAIGASVIWFEAIRTPRLLREIDAIVGIAAIAYAVFTFDVTTNFPYAGALYPCIGTAFLIYAGGSPLVARLWNNSPMIAIGRISYSLYLVHWPVVTFYSYWRIVPLDMVERVGLVAASFVFALPLHFLVERRYRYADPRGSRGNTAVLSSVAAATCVVIALAGSVWLSGGWPWRHPLPAFDVATTAKIRNLCEGGTGICPGPQKIVLVGDSHAGNIQIAVAETLKKAHLAASIYPPASSCFFLQDAFPVYRLTDIAANECPSAMNRWRGMIEAENPDVVILAGFWVAGMEASISGPMVRQDSKSFPTDAESRNLFEQQMIRTVDWLTTHGRKVIIIGTSPIVYQPPPICYERPHFLGDPDCTKLNVIVKPEAHTATTRFLSSLQRPGVLYVDLMSKLCAGDICPLGENGVSFYYDRHHLNAYGELWLADRAFGPMVDFLKSQNQIVDHASKGRETGP